MTLPPLYVEGRQAAAPPGTRLTNRFAGPQLQPLVGTALKVLGRPACGVLRDRRYLLAMKLMAMRFGEDDQDIEILLRECGIHNAQEALDVLKQLFPAKEPPAKTRFFLEELLGG